MQAGCRQTFWLLLLAWPLLGAGCGTPKNELLESELRHREFQYRDALDELRKIQFHNQALQQEISSLRHGTLLSPETAAQTFGLKRITLGRGTGGYEADNLPGDEALQVTLEPRDSEDHIIKAPGSLNVTALEIIPGGVKKPFSNWTVDPEHLRRSWKAGLLSTGYVLVLPWKSWPTTEQIRVVVQLVTSDGRVFEADRDVKIRVIPLHPHMPAPTPGPLLPTDGAWWNQRVPIPSATHSKTTSAWRPLPLEGAVQLGPPRGIE